MNLVELLTKQGLTARTLESSKHFTEFQKAFLASPLPNRFPKSSTTTVMSDPDDTDEEPTTPPSSPTHGAQLQTSTLLHQVMQRLVGASLRTFETLTTTLASSDDHDDEVEEHFAQQRIRRRMTITPPSSPTFDGLAAPTPNTALHAMKTSTFLRVSSLNPYTHQSLRQAFTQQTSPGEIPSAVNDFLRGRFPRI